MTVLVHSIAIICFKFLFVDRLGPTATLIGSIAVRDIQKVHSGAFYFFDRLENTYNIYS